MAIQSATKFIAEFYLKVRRLRKRLAEDLQPDEVETILQSIRVLESESQVYCNLLRGVEMPEELEVRL